MHCSALAAVRTSRTTSTSAVASEPGSFGGFVLVASCPLLDTLGKKGTVVSTCMPPPDTCEIELGCSKMCNAVHAGHRNKYLRSCSLYNLGSKSCSDNGHATSAEYKGCQLILFRYLHRPKTSQWVDEHTLTSRMLVASARLLMTGPSTKVGQMVTSSKLCFLLASHAALSAATCIIYCAPLSSVFMISTHLAC